LVFVEVQSELLPYCNEEVKWKSDWFILFAFNFLQFFVFLSNVFRFSGKYKFSQLRKIANIQQLSCFCFFMRLENLVTPCLTGSYSA